MLIVENDFVIGIVLVWRQKNSGCHCKFGKQNTNRRTACRNSQM